MTPLEILHEIVTTEHNARELYAAAVREKESFDEALNQKVSELRQDYFEKADGQIAAFEKCEIEAANEEIRKLDQGFDRSIAAMQEYYEANKEALARKIFNITLGKDPGEGNA